MTLGRVLVFVAMSIGSVSTVVGQPFPPVSTDNTIDTAATTTPLPSSICDLTGEWSGNWPPSYTGPSGSTAGPIISVRRAAVTNMPGAQFMAGGGAFPQLHARFRKLLQN